MSLKRNMGGNERIYLLRRHGVNTFCEMKIFTLSHTQLTHNSHNSQLTTHNSQLTTHTQLTHNSHTTHTPHHFRFNITKKGNK
jgi:hypothetical protein